MGYDARNLSLGFQTTSGSNQSAQLQRLARMLKFSMKQVKIQVFNGGE